MCSKKDTELCSKTFVLTQKHHCVPGLCILSNNLTDLADTTPPRCDMKPGGNDFIVINGYS